MYKKQKTHNMPALSVFLSFTLQLSQFKHRNRFTKQLNEKKDVSSTHSTPIDALVLRSRVYVRFSFNRCIWFVDNGHTKIDRSAHCNIFFFFWKFRTLESQQSNYSNYVCVCVNCVNCYLTWNERDIEIKSKITNKPTFFPRVLVTVGHFTIKFSHVIKTKLTFRYKLHISADIWPSFESGGISHTLKHNVNINLIRKVNFKESI